MTTLWRCRDHQRVLRQPGQQEAATISTWRESGTNGTEEWCTQELWTQHPKREGTGKVTPNPSLFLPCCLLLVTLIEANWQGHLKDIGQWGWSQKEWISDWIIKKNIQTMKTEVFFFYDKCGAWRDVSAAFNTCCSCRGHRFCFQHPPSDSQPPETLVPVDLIPNSGLHTRCTCKDEWAAHTRINKIIIVLKIRWCTYRNEAKRQNTVKEVLYICQRWQEQYLQTVLHWGSTP